VDNPPIDGETAYVVAATTGEASYLVVANSLDEGTVSTQGNGTEVIGGTYWVYKGLDYVFALVYNKGGAGTGASYYLGADGKMKEKYTYTYNRITSYGTWGDKVVTVSTGDSKITDEDQNVAQALLFNYLDATDGSQEEGTLLAENYLGNGEKVSWAGLVEANNKIYTSVIPMGMSKYGIKKWPEAVTDQELVTKTDGGFECDLESGETLSQTTENVGYRICKELDFDILLTGHQHMSVPGRDISGTYTVQPCDNAKEYQYLEVTMTDHEKSIRSELRQSDAAKGTVLADKYRSTENAVQAWLNQPIGHLSRAILPEEKVKMALYGSPIADFLNRIQLHFSGAMLSSVGLANEIAGFRSEVSTRDIIATYPYPNTLVVCEITGKQLKNVMERSAEYFAYDKDGNVCVSDSFLVPKVEHYNYDYYMGVDFEINPKNPVGSRIVGLSRDGKPVLDEDKFTLCLNNYRYSGAGGYDVYTECPLVKEINVEMVELIMDYFHEYPYIEV
jgi:hypothetical protein